MGGDVDRCLVDGLGYVVLEVADLARSVAFYRDVIKLSVTYQDDRLALLGNGTDHHWVRLEQGASTRLVRLGYQAHNAESVRRLTERLDARGIAWTAPADGDLRRDGLRSVVRFRDVDDVEVDVFETMLTLPVPKSDPRVRPTALLHAVWFVADPAVTSAFYAEVLGFRASDWIEDMAVFMRAGNGYHHGLAVFGTDAAERRGSLDHFCILLKDIDDLMIARNYALASGSPIAVDLLRHSASGSASVYFNEPSLTHMVELCVWHGRITDEDYRARVLPAWGTTRDMWHVGPEDVGAMHSDPDKALAELANQIS
jgi:catechol 2,3-dioxygenase-like lactoylglutathione lyase family enzyme